MGKGVCVTNSFDILFKICLLHFFHTKYDEVFNALADSLRNHLKTCMLLAHLGKEKSWSLKTSI
jgi:hypothetical protein